jgi:predicted Zn-ribbon and HTH transcriptional regulator
MKPEYEVQYWMRDKKVRVIICKKCNHEWQQRELQAPKQCPNCKKRYMTTLVKRKV